jgi:hypothetical protein
MRHVYGRIRTRSCERRTVAPEVPPSRAEAKGAGIFLRGVAGKEVAMTTYRNGPDHDGDDQDDADEKSGGSWLIEDVVGGAIDTAADMVEGTLGLDTDD